MNPYLLGMDPYLLGMDPYPLVCYMTIYKVWYGMVWCVIYHTKGMDPYPVGMDPYLLGMDPYLKFI